MNGFNVTDRSLYPTDIEGIEIKYVDEGALQGFHLVPEDKRYRGIIICYGGSEGGPNFEEAKRLAMEGCETLAVFMFGMKNQPKTLTKVPLEQFEDVLRYIRPKIGTEPITILGTSKGAEYALNLATKYPEISNLILIAPSAYNFAGLDFDHYGSSWTWQGKELPYIDLKDNSFIKVFKSILLPALLKSRSHIKRCMTQRSKKIRSEIKSGSRFKIQKPISSCLSEKMIKCGTVPIWRRSFGAKERMFRSFLLKMQDIYLKAMDWSISNIKWSDREEMLRTIKRHIHRA